MTPVLAPAPIPRSALAQRVVLTGFATATMAAALYAIHRSAAQRGPATVSRQVAPLVAALPIVKEADAFRTKAPAVDPRRRPNAHPRTLATFRVLRSYPGAPPRVPHGLTSAEFRTNRCKSCHERGGFAQRFGAYAPITPHPELAGCLQCHATNRALVGVSFPERAPNERCRQCHAGVPSRFEESGLNWRTMQWPRLAERRTDVVPPIAHDLDMRGNCLACHAGAGAVAEIRTTHPERADCRACHVERRLDGVFVRSAPTKDLIRAVP